MSASSELYVPDTRFGVWFLGTRTWSVHVLARALDDLERLMPSPRRAPGGVIADVGCGAGHSFRPLQERFAPAQLIGIDCDPRMIAMARQRISEERLAVELRQGHCDALPLDTGSVDILFCHQTFHHLNDQPSALVEFRRVLKPGGLLLFAESTRAYIHSWSIRLLFRHPMEVQRTAEEYLAMVRAAGFEVTSEAVSYPYLWWSRPDLGIAERWFGIAPGADREETLINLVGVRA